MCEADTTVGARSAERPTRRLAALGAHAGLSTGCWTLNGEVVAPGPYPARLRRVVGIGAHRAARAEIGSWPGYGPTPLRSADRLAGRLGVEAVWVKDESGRFGLGSFKALGGGWGG
ncbi:MAG: pyridoxal-phosphate dependent enzyme, partial [Gemmatimonadetes bacterium]|nr:pyridoxal-phosphate dependent enzyme [Gemmatimonadota bacterium]